MFIAGGRSDGGGSGELMDNRDNRDNRNNRGQIQ